MKKFKILSDINYPIDGFSVTINDLNFNYINEDFIKWAANEGFRDIASDVDLINTINSSRTVDDCVKKLIDLRNCCLKYKIENFGSWTTAYHNLVNDTENEMPTFCKAVKGNNISINPEGKIFICGHTTTVLGDINDFENVFSINSPYYKLIEKRLPGNNTDCYNCYIEGVCSGQCQITNEVAKTTKNNRDHFLCDLYRKATYILLQKKLELELKEINNNNL